MRLIGVLTFMPNAFIRTPTSRPILPNPRMANVLPYSSEPLYNLRSHLPSFMLCAAGTTGRANVAISKHVNSQAEIEFPPGVLYHFDSFRKSGKKTKAYERRKVFCCQSRTMELLGGELLRHKLCGRLQSVFFFKWTYFKTMTLCLVALGISMLSTPAPALKKSLDKWNDEDTMVSQTMQSKAANDSKMRLWQEGVTYRPTALSLPAPASITSAVTLVSDRTTSAS